MSPQSLVVGALVVSGIVSGSSLVLASTRAERFVRYYEVAYPVSTTRRPAGAPLPTGAHYEARLGTYSTRFSESRANEGRAFNVRKVARAIDGVVIAPGATFSFNDTTGPRNYRSGYRRAPVVIRGELEDGVGGGVCQVASTLHAAAREAGLEIVERKPHTRPSHYIRRRLEAAVSYPDLDLKIRNPLPHPVAISATAIDGRVEVAILAPPVH